MRGQVAVKNCILKKSIEGLCLIVCLGFILTPSGFAVPGHQQIVLLDREPFYSPPSISLKLDKLFGGRINQCNRIRLPMTGVVVEENVPFIQGIFIRVNNFPYVTLRLGPTPITVISILLCGE